MPIFIKIKINNTIEGFIQQADIVNFTIARNINTPLLSLTLEINNIEKYLDLFLTKISFFKLFVVVDNSINEFEPFYPYKSELKGSTIILHSKNIKENLANKLYNRVFKDQTLQCILDTLSQELDCTKALVDSRLKSIKINKLEQNNKNNLTILEELSKIYYAYTYLTPEGLLFIKPNTFERNIFRNTPELRITDNNILSIKKSTSAYKSYKGVKCKYFDNNTNAYRKLFLGYPTYLEIESPYDKELTTRLTQSQYKKIRETDLLEITVLKGMYFNVDMYISIPANTQQYDQFIGIYFIMSIEHRFYNNNLTCLIVAYKVN